MCLFWALPTLGKGPHILYGYRGPSPTPLPYHRAPASSHSFGHCPATRTLIFNALVQRGIDFPDLDYGKHPSFMFYNIINPTWEELLKLPVTAQIIPTLSLFSTSRPHVQAALKEVLSLINVKTSSISDFIFIELAFDIPLSTFNLPTEVEKDFT